MKEFQLPYKNTNKLTNKEIQRKQFKALGYKTRKEKVNSIIGSNSFSPGDGRGASHNINKKADLDQTVLYTCQWNLTNMKKIRSYYQKARQQQQQQKSTSWSNRPG